MARSPIIQTGRIERIFPFVPFFWVNRLSTLLKGSYLENNVDRDTMSLKEINSGHFVYFYAVSISYHFRIKTFEFGKKTLTKKCFPLIVLIQTFPQTSWKK